MDPLSIVQIPRRYVKDEWGGTETVVLETSKQLQSRGHRIQILTPNALASNDAEVMDGIPVRRFSYFYPWLGLDDAARLRLDKKGGNLFSFALWRALKREQPLDLIHLHTQKRLGGIGRHVAKKRGIPYVVSLHGGVLDVPVAEQQDMLNPVAGKIEWGKALGAWVGSRRVLDDAAAIVCVGRAEEEKIRARYPNTRVVFLPNGVDTAKYREGDGPRFRTAYGVPADAPTVLLLSRIDPQKNQLGAVQAIARLADAHLVLVGPVTNAAYLEKVREEAERLGVADRLTVVTGLPHASRDLIDAYHAADVFCLPSIHEPFGIVALEAWAAGLPLVASRVGGLPSFVVDGENGLLVPPGDVEALAHALDRTLSDTTLARRLAAAGHLLAAEQYDWARITDKLLALYAEVLGRPAPAPAEVHA